MRGSRVVFPAVVVLLMLSAWASGPAASVTREPAAAPTPAATATEIGEKEFEDFDPRNFGRPTTIDNEWFPLKPGTQFVYDGYTEKDGNRISHRVVFTVTDLTKVIDGVRTVVIYDQDYSDGEIEELELTFFAQDNDGNVWHLGQLREAYDKAEFVGSQAWLVGTLEGARAGQMMKAKPQFGTPSYSEGYAPAPFFWTDRGRIHQMDQRVTVPFGIYDRVLVVQEFSQRQPEAFQFKYYARGLGVVRIGWGGSDTTRETLDLIDFFQLNPDALAQARAEALEMEARAYVYGRTQPAEGPAASPVSASGPQPPATPPGTPTRGTP